MNREKMLELLKAGVPPIDVTILKWEERLEFGNEHLASRNCAMCETVRPNGIGTCDDCLLYKYKVSFESLNEEDNTGGCGGFYTSGMTHEAEQCMLQFLYRVKELMIEDGLYPVKVKETVMYIAIGVGDTWLESTWEVEGVKTYNGFITLIPNELYWNTRLNMLYRIIPKEDLKKWLRQKR